MPPLVLSAYEISSALERGTPTIMEGIYPSGLLDEALISCGSILIGEDMSTQFSFAPGFF